MHVYIYIYIYTYIASLSLLTYIYIYIHIVFCMRNSLGWLRLGWLEIAKPNSNSLKLDPY